MTYLATKDGQSAEAHNAQPRGLDEADYFSRTVFARPSRLSGDANFW